MSIDFKLDKTQFAALSFQEADKAINDYANYSPKERLIIANRLIAIAYNFPLGNPPAMDKTIFKASAFKHG